MLKADIKFIIVGTIAAVAVLVFLFILFLPKQEVSEPQVTTESAPFALDANGFMTYSGAYTTGIDVSGYQGEIDWQKVKKAGIEFVFIKVGSRGTTEGKLYEDDFARRNYEGAKEAGIQTGVYFYSQAITPEEALEEARFTLEQIAGWELDLPVVYDWEWGGEGSRTTALDKETLTLCAESFCQTIEEAGYSPMLYFNKSQGLEQMDLDRLKKYPFWLAQYGGEMTFPYDIQYWQYSQTGTVYGIDGNVDLNICILE